MLVYIENIPKTMHIKILNTYIGEEAKRSAAYKKQIPIFNSYHGERH
jgi:hypothetical protein